jgi:hypothetical protein
VAEKWQGWRSGGVSNIFLYLLSGNGGKVERPVIVERGKCSNRRNSVNRGKVTMVETWQR